MPKTNLKIEMDIELPGETSPVHVEFSGEDIIKADVTEEVDIVSLSLPASSFDFEVYTEDPRFELFEDAAFSSALSSYQKIKVSALSGDESDFVNYYYVQARDVVSENIYKFKCTDIVGLMDIIQFDGMFFKDRTLLESALVVVLFDTGIDFVLDFPHNVYIRGWIAPGTLREAIHQIAFAVGGSVTNDEHGGIKISPSRITGITEQPTYRIPKRIKIDRQSVAREPSVSSVTVQSHEYVPEYVVGDPEELFEDTLPMGYHEIYLPGPCHHVMVGFYSTPPGTNPENRVFLPVDQWGEVKINHHTVEVDQKVECTVLITGHKWKTSSRSFKATNEDYETIRIKNDVVIEGATLLDKFSSGIVRDVMKIYYFDSVFIQTVEIIRRISPIDLNLGAEYGQKRYGSFRYIREGDAFGGIGSIRPNDSVDVQTINGKTIRGIVEMMELDLVGGMIAKLRIRGYELKE